VGKSTEMRGRTCVVTGATSGIGRAAARELARRGARVVVVARSREKGEAALEELRAVGEAEPELLLADLSSQAQIRRVAAEILERCPRIDVLLNNAGVVNLSRTETEDGLETVFAVNHLAYFLLTLLLLERLKETPGARVVNVASEAHRFGRLDWDDLMSERSFRTMRTYGRSKLANILFTRELARRLEGSGVTVNCLHPGGVATGLGSNNAPWIQWLLMTLGRPFLRSPEKGAETAVHLAVSPEVEGVSGRYFADRRERRPSRDARDDAAARRLWELSERLTGLA
jgi:NAD(P)-dependent dehydrogenase (short-subunit alcohol dehydrogenase family)